MEKHKKKVRRKRRAWSEDFKKGLVAAYLRGEQTMEELGSPHDLAPAQISQWVKRYSTNGKLLLADDQPQASDQRESEISDREDAQQVSRLKKELEQMKLQNMALEALIEAAEEATGRQIRKKIGPGQWKS
jgi:transposase-like protein